MDMDIVRKTLIGATTPSFTLLAMLLTYVSLSLRPGFVPLVILVSVIINYARATVKRPEFAHRFFALLAALTMGTSALSTWFLSESLLLVAAALFSFISLLPILGFAYFRSYVGSRFPLSGLLLFPVLWATTWSLVVHFSPVAEYTGAWLMGTEARRLIPDDAAPNVDFLTSINNETEATDIDHANNCDPHRPPATRDIPSHFTPILPPPMHSSSTTELMVACAHPAVKTPGTHPSFEDYLAETRVQAPRAKIVLWPEGAVRFHSDEQKKIAFKNISDIANHQKAWIGVGYEQTFQDRDVYDGLQRVRGHNALAIFGPDVQPVVYIKQKLVPLVESFSYEHSIVPPPNYPLRLPKPNSRPKSEKDTWPRTIPLSAAICLDVSAPLAHLTWHPDLGKTMFQYASMRAAEQGASILWCDGGEGGVSGVGGLAAQGLGLTGGIGQVGTGGSWLQTIGIPFPYDARDFTPTWYARWGDLSVIILGLALLGVGPVAPAVVWGYGRLKATRRQANGQHETAPLLA
ncbi:hypothetical protein B0J17DRAFT_639009 [Rhizoctonia solani]|nr:hypothetical protein B0J17DRAFT_639009 [Rhizoctonia solani]